MEYTSVNARDVFMGGENEMQDRKKPGYPWKATIEIPQDFTCSLGTVGSVWIPYAEVSARGMNDALKKGIRLSKQEVFLQRPDIRETRVIASRSLGKGKWEIVAHNIVKRPGSNEEAVSNLKAFKKERKRLLAPSADQEALEWITNAAFEQRQVERAFEAGYLRCSQELAKPGITKVPPDDIRKWGTLVSHYEEGWKKRLRERQLEKNPYLWFDFDYG